MPEGRLGIVDAHQTGFHYPLGWEIGQTTPLRRKVWGRIGRNEPVSVNLSAVRGRGNHTGRITVSPHQGEWFGEGLPPFLGRPFPALDGSGGVPKTLSNPPRSLLATQLCRGAPGILSGFSLVPASVQRGLSGPGIRPGASLKRTRAPQRHRASRGSCQNAATMRVR